VEENITTTNRNFDLNYNSKRPMVVRALRRSYIRRDIAKYLCSINPECCRTTEIATQVKSSSTNVIGALRGLGSRYKTDESLISLNIVEETIEKSHGKDIKLYKITNFGNDVLTDFQRK